MITVEDLKAAYAAGFAASGQGYNAHWPFEDGDFVDEEKWIRQRDEWIVERLNGASSSASTVDNK